jgi:hypothetical protein
MYVMRNNIYRFQWHIFSMEVCTKGIIIFPHKIPMINKNYAHIFSPNGLFLWRTTLFLLSLSFLTSYRISTICQFCKWHNISNKYFFNTRRTWSIMHSYLEGLILFILFKFFLTIWSTSIYKGIIICLSRNTIVVYEDGWNRDNNLDWFSSYNHTLSQFKCVILYSNLHNPTCCEEKINHVFAMVRILVLSAYYKVLSLNREEHKTDSPLKREDWIQHGNL